MKTVRERMFRVEHAHHLTFFDKQYGRGCNRGGRRHTNGLTCQASFAEKIARAQNRHDGLFAILIDDRKFYTALLDVFHTVCGIALRENLFGFPKLDNLTRHANRIKGSLGVECHHFL